MSNPDLERPSAGTDRYADGVKWVVSLATGAVALGLGPASFDSFSRAELLAFSAAAAFLFLTILAGVFCGLNLIGYASHSEESRRIYAELEEAKTDTAKAELLRRDLKVTVNAAEGGKRVGTRLFYASISLFVLGMLSFVTLIGLSAAGRQSAHTPFRQLVQYNVSGLLSPVYLDPTTRRAYRMVVTDSGVVVQEVPLHVEEIDAR